MKKKQVLWMIGGGLLLLFLLFTVLVATVDLAPIGPNNSTVGFSTINAKIRDAIGINEGFYKITELLGMIAIAVAAGFAALGAVQIIKRKSPKRVDGDLFVLGGFYAVVVAAYALFEVVVINQRPVLVDGVLEASYPSSHTILTVCIMATAILQLHKRISKKPIRIASELVCGAILAVTVIGRLLSGVHWMTDIVGGALLSAALVVLYAAAVETLCQKKKD